MDKTRFYIRDCFGNIAGNPKGYRTMRGALIQADSRKSKVHWALWQRFNTWEDRNPSENLVYSIGDID
jgi:hypothetical protein